MRPLLLALTLLAAGLAATPALAQNRFWLVNESGLTVEHAYISPSRLSDWGNDILGGTRLAPGEQVRVSPAAKDCVLDIKVEYKGGQAEEKMEVDACRLNRVVFTNFSGRTEAPRGATGLADNDPGGIIRRDGEEEATLSPALPGHAEGGNGVRLGLGPLADEPWRRLALAGQP